MAVDSSRLLAVLQLLGEIQKRQPRVPSAPSLNLPPVKFLPEHYDAAVASRARGGGGGGGNPFTNLLGDVLNVVDTPRAAVFSLGTEIGQGLGNLLVPDYQQKNPGEHFSFADLWNQTVHPEDRIYGSDILGLAGVKNPVAKIAGGFTLDVAGDPLNAVSPSGLIHGPRAVAEHIATEAARDIAETTGRELTIKDLAQIAKGGAHEATNVPEVAAKVSEIRQAAQDALEKVRRGGISALSQEQLDRYGLSKGLSVKLPGGRELALTTGEGALSKLSTGRRQLQAGIGDILLGTDKPQLFGHMLPGAANKLAARQGDFTSTLTELARGGMFGERASMERRFGSAYNTIVKGYKPDEIQNAFDLIHGGAVEDLTPRVEELAGNLSKHHEDMRAALEAAGIPIKALGPGKYAPSPVTRDAVEAMVAAGLHPAEDESAHARSFFENRRTIYKDGDTEAHIGRDAVDDFGNKVSERVTIPANNRVEAMQGVSKVVADRVLAQADADRAAMAVSQHFVPSHATIFLQEHPEIEKAMRDGTYSLYQEPRAAMQSYVQSTARRISQAHAVQKMYAAGEGLLRFPKPDEATLAPADLEAMAAGKGGFLGQEADLRAAAEHAQQAADAAATTAPQSPLEGLAAQLAPQGGDVLGGGLPPALPAHEVPPLGTALALDRIDTAFSRAEQLLGEKSIAWGEGKVPPAIDRQMREIAQELNIPNADRLSTAKLKDAVQAELEQYRSQGTLKYGIFNEARAAQEAQKAKALAAEPDYLYREGRAGAQRFEQQVEAKRVFDKNTPEITRIRHEVLPELQAKLEHALAHDTPVERAPQTAAERKLFRLRGERDQLRLGAGMKNELDSADAVSEAERLANEASVPEVGPPVPRPNQEDALASQLIHLHLADLDSQIRTLEDRIAKDTGAPVMQSDLVRREIEDAQRQISRLNGEIETAKKPLLRPLPENPTLMTPNPKGALQAAIDKYAAAAQEDLKYEGLTRAIGDREVEPLGGAPLTSVNIPRQGNEMKLRTDALTASARASQNSVVKSEATTHFFEAEANVIRKSWEQLGETVTQHQEAQRAFTDFHKQLNAGMAPSPERDLTALSSTQIDQLGLLSNDPTALDATVEKLTQQTDAVTNGSGHVTDDFVQYAKETADGVKAWRMVADEAAKVNDPIMAEVARLNIVAHDLAFQADQMAMRAGGLGDKLAVALKEREAQDIFLGGMQDYLQYRSLAPGILTPRDVADAIMHFDAIEPPKFKRLVKAWDRANHWFKAWAIARPGFHERNLFGGMFNNMFGPGGGVDASSYAGFFKAWMKHKLGRDLGDDLERWNEVIRHLEPGQAISETGLGNPLTRLAQGPVPLRSRILPGAKNAIPEFSAHVGGDVEFFLRGSLMWDAMKKGLSPDEATSWVHRLHFNYADLSSIDQKIKRFVPFYTWTRNNLPLQLQQLAENPKVFARYQQLSQEIQAQSGADPIVPGYFVENGAIRLPAQKGGGSLYYMPDLPLRDLNLLQAPADLLFGQGDFGARFNQAISQPASQVSPFITGPIEWSLGHQFYKDIPLNNDRPVALDDLGLPSWLTAPLRLTPFVSHDSVTGRDYMTERDLFVIDKLTPLFAQVRRAFSNEPKMNERRMGWLISYFLGAQVRTNTKDDQQIAFYLSSLESKRRRSISRRLSGGG